MGPGCFHPRNLRGLAARGDVGLLQWGRDVSIPEMMPADKPYNGGLGASMGPGCFHPRNVLRKPVHSQPRVASMGPGCFHPRNLRDFQPLVLPVTASMGPGCFHPRNTRLYRRCYCSFARFNGAGMFPSQKYRDSAVVILDVLASMGPGCFHPRNAPNRAALATWSGLQWGRDVSIPEMPAW